MTRAVAIRTRDAWSDRWAKPTWEDLLEPQKAQSRKLLQMLTDALDAYPNVQKELTWFGQAWKWTLHYTLHDAKGRRLQTLCYVVPRPEQPLVSVPLTEQVLGRLPMRRLPRQVRDGIRSAKFALSMHWATWTPMLMADVNALLELTKRKHKIVLGSDLAKQDASNN